MAAFLERIAANHMTYNDYFCAILNGVGRIRGFLAFFVPAQLNFGLSSDFNDREGLVAHSTKLFESLKYF
jgi:hypothetical protein